MRDWRAGGLVLAVLLGITGCGHDVPHPLKTGASASTAAAAYDAGLPPARAVMSLVPASATTLRVTDYDQIKTALGLGSVTGKAPAVDQQQLWQRADREAAQVSGRLLRSADATLVRQYGWGAADVRWEAVFAGGFVIRLADGVRPAAAIQAGVGPLKGATFDPATHLVTKGTAARGADTWASDRTLTQVAGEPAASTYVVKGCAKVAGATSPTLAPVKAYAVELGSRLATVRLGERRPDLFERMRLDAGVPAYAAAFRAGVADPGTGRIGFKISDPVAAARLVLEEPLPFAACDS